MCMYIYVNDGGCWFGSAHLSTDRFRLIQTFWLQNTGLSGGRQKRKWGGGETWARASRLLDSWHSIVCSAPSYHLRCCCCCCCSGILQACATPFRRVFCVLWVACADILILPFSAVLKVRYRYQYILHNLHSIPYKHVRASQAHIIEHRKPQGID